MAEVFEERMTLRKYLQKLGILYGFEPGSSSVEIKPGKDVAVSNENLDTARKYVDAVMHRLRREIVTRGVDTAILQSQEDDHTEWELHSGRIRGLGQITHDGRPWPLKAPSDDSVVDDDAPQRYDVAAVVLLPDVCFEATYSYTSNTQTVSGQVTGKIAIVRLDLIIGRPERSDGFPEVSLFEVTEYTRVIVPKNSLGVLNETIFKEAIEKVLHGCIGDAMSCLIVPVLSDVLKHVPYPNFI
ncbi:uncharacterized protein LOC142795001 [Rhipicephalus microplus]|uniref:uncharacterized protein LOC142795001 n=1 Tax=Rhipicephalus microplus TaxID=6941 RepID=UPI003F6CA669